MHIDVTPSNDAPWINAKSTLQASKAAEARKVSGRRRGVDPATCERDYKADEMEFMGAMQEYKRTSGRMFPTWSEVLEVLKDMGYERTESKAMPTGYALTR